MAARRLSSAHRSISHQPPGPKRFSDKLSLVYEQGLSVANNALKIEYALSRTVTLRAEVGFVNGFGIYYSGSFD